MPAVSIRQRRAMAIAEHDPAKLKSRNRGLLSMSRGQLHDFAATPEHDLPERAPKMGLQLKKAIKHPGALTAAARRNGRSKRQEAEKESHSSNPSVRGRGLLGLRFMRGGDLHK